MVTKMSTGEAFLFPTHCILCGQKTARQLLCALCHKRLPWQSHGCIQCGYPISGGTLSEKARCGQCIQSSPSYHRTLCIFEYEPPIAQLILGLKFGGKLCYGRVLGELAAAHLEKKLDGCLPQAIIPVPLHRERLRTRGYNQATEIAKPIGKALRIPLELRACYRTTLTLPQSQMTAEQRRENLFKAFWVPKTFHLEHVAIVDDVLTTGNTVHALSHALHTAGIKKIEIWCCARTLLKMR